MRTILLILALVAIAIPVNADHCATYSTYGAQYDTKIVSQALGTDRYYGADDCFPLVYCQLVLMSFWVYQESNGIDGLQRGDEVVDNTCHGLLPADTIVF